MAKRPGHVDVVTEVGFCNFCGRTRNLRREVHHLGGLLRVVTTCEACHRTLSSTMEVAQAQAETKPEPETQPAEAEAKPQPARRTPAARATPATAKGKPATAAKPKAPAKPKTKAATAAKPRGTTAPKKTSRGK